LVADHGERPPAPGGQDLDAALVRLEDLLLALPFDRALPDIDGLLARAEVPADLLRRDDRALKLLHEAIVARPFGSLDVIQQVRTEVGLLTLEVELLTDRLADPAATAETIALAEGRLAEVRRRLAAIRDEL
jgi:hypothetical protein